MNRTNTLLNLLDDAGWYRGRKIDISYMIDDLEREELTLPNEPIAKLLEEYWNIELTYKRKDGIDMHVRLNVDTAINMIDPELLAMYETQATERLVPVGTVYFDSSIFLLSYSGKGFSASHGEIYKLGNDFFSSLEKMLFE